MQRKITIGQFVGIQPQKLGGRYDILFGRTLISTLFETDYAGCINGHFR
jgi:hypothetical protein